MRIICAVALTASGVLGLSSRMNFWLCQLVGFSKANCFQHVSRKRAHPTSRAPCIFLIVQSARRRWAFWIWQLGIASRGKGWHEEDQPRHSNVGVWFLCFIVCASQPHQLLAAIFGVLALKGTFKESELFRVILKLFAVGCTSIGPRLRKRKLDRRAPTQGSNSLLVNSCQANPRHAQRVKETYADSFSSETQSNAKARYNESHRCNDIMGTAERCFKNCDGHVEEIVPKTQSDIPGPQDGSFAESSLEQVWYLKRNPAPCGGEGLKRSRDAQLTLFGDEKGLSGQLLKASLDSVAPVAGCCAPRTQGEDSPESLRERERRKHLI